MPLPKKTIRVFPNPWVFIHHETGPQGHCHEDTGGRGTTPRYIGAESCPDKTVKVGDFESDNSGSRLDHWVICFRFPVLNSDLLTPAKGFEDGIELPKTPYYLDRLRDGDLIPADERSGEHGARFASLSEARAASIAVFEEHYGKGAFAEVSPELGDPVAVAATPDAKAARSGRLSATSASSTPALSSVDTGAAQ